MLSLKSGILNLTPPSFVAAIAGEKLLMLRDSCCIHICCIWSSFVARLGGNLISLRQLEQLLLVHAHCCIHICYILLHWLHSNLVKLCCSAKGNLISLRQALKNFSFCKLSLAPRDTLIAFGEIVYSCCKCFCRNLINNLKV